MALARNPVRVYHRKRREAAVPTDGVRRRTVTAQFTPPTGLCPVR